MKRFCYDGVLPQWKVKLVQQRARRLGFRDDQLDDVMQDLALTLSEVKHDADHANGATEATMLTSVIDRQLCKMRRAESRREGLEQRVALSGDEYYDNSDVERRLDVETVVAMLNDKQQEVCRLLNEGHNKSAIARQLGCGWHAVDRITRDIRRHFEKHGLGED